MLGDVDNVKHYTNSVKYAYCVFLTRVCLASRDIISEFLIIFVKRLEDCLLKVICVPFLYCSNDQFGLLHVRPFEIMGPHNLKYVFFHY